MAVRIINIGVFLRWVLTFPDMFVLRLARSDFGLPFLPFFAPFSFFCFISVFHFDKCFEKNRLSSPTLCQAGFLFPPLSLFFYYRGGFTNVRRRFGDERDGIIPIPALPLSCSNSLTKLSDSILDPTARVNLLCHSQSTRGSAKSRSSPCQNPPTAPLFRCVKVHFLSLHYVSLLIFLIFSSVFCLCGPVCTFTLVIRLPGVFRDVYRQRIFLWLKKFR